MFVTEATSATTETMIAAQSALEPFDPFSWPVVVCRLVPSVPLLPDMSYLCLQRDECPRRDRFPHSRPTVEGGRVWWPRPRPCPAVLHLHVYRGPIVSTVVPSSLPWSHRRPARLRLKVLCTGGEKSSSKRDRLRTAKCSDSLRPPYQCWSSTSCAQKVPCQADSLDANYRQ